MSNSNESKPEKLGQPIPDWYTPKMHNQTTICGAKTKHTGLPCRRIPINGTGRCSKHGGKSKGPTDPTKLIGNTNSLKTGEYQPIWFDTLDEEEKELVQHIDTSALKQIDDALKLIDIRERRMMKLAQQYREEQDELIETAVHIIYGKEPKSEDAEYDEHGEVVRKPVQITQVMGSKIELIHRVEEAMTRVAEKKARFIDLRHKVASGQQDNKTNVSAFIDALNKSVNNIWKEEEGKVEE